MAQKLHKGLLALLKPAQGQSPSVPAMFSPSNRWAMHDKGNLYGGKQYNVTHVPTGVAARVGLPYAQAKALLWLLEEVPTPVLDALPFGEFGKEQSDLAKADLMALKDVVFGGAWK